MKLRAALFTIALAATFNLYPAIAETDQAKAQPKLSDEDDTAIAAKDMFKRQLQAPAGTALNTGIQYWIELTTNGESLRANNKTAFHSGDQVRFHVKPNIDGYAYIVMKNGSQGQQEVLFPDSENAGQNKINRGQELVIPPDGAFEFDKNPGVERLSLYVSRKPIDPSIYAKSAKEDDKPVAVAMNFGGKDLIPSGVFIAYMPDAEDSTRKKLNAAKKENTAPVPNKPTSVILVKSKTSKTSIAKTTTTKPVVDKLTVKPPTTKPTKPTKSESSMVTVVSKDTDGILSADIALQHF
jgi:Domain of unknown function (DUF4384)